MATVVQLATGKVVETQTEAERLYYQGEADTAGGYSIDGVVYPEKVDVPDAAEVASGDVFDPAEHTVDEVLAHLGESTPQEQARVITAEDAGKARKGILEFALTED